MKTKTLWPVIVAALALGACAPHRSAKPTPVDPQVARNAKNKPIGTTRLCETPGTTCATPQ